MRVPSKSLNVPYCEVLSSSRQIAQYSRHVGCYATATGVWSPGKVDVDDCGRQFVPFVAQQQQQQVRPANSVYVDATTPVVRYAPPYQQHAVS